MAIGIISDTLCAEDVQRVALPYGFDVRKTFDCGQCFRFEPVENSEFDAEYAGVAYGRFVSFAQKGSELYIFNSTKEEFENIWRSYLALDVDYEHIDRDISRRAQSAALDAAIACGSGIRILRQERWEAVCSFIISQNNNIPRIKKIIENMARECGKKIDVPERYRSKLSGREAYSFPTPSELASLGEAGIFALRTGFRAKYIYDACKKVLDGEIDLLSLEEVRDTDEAIKRLCAIKGVGPKVASCALLFGFAKYDAFPVDVWIKRVIEKYFLCSPEDFSPKFLGEYAGIAQQYLFYYERYIVSEQGTDK